MKRPVPRCGGSRPRVLGLALLALLILAGPSYRPQAALRRGVDTLDADARTLHLAHDAGFDTVVQLFGWRQIEPTRGEYHWEYPDQVVQGARYYRMDLVIRLDQHPAWASAAPLSVNAPPDDLADYAAFVRAVAARYRGLVLGYVLWNEPNLAREWGGKPPDPAGYAALLKAGYEAVKAADPEALVISAGLATTGDQNREALDDRLFLAQMYEAGARPFFDVLAAHPYGFAYPPDDPPGAHNGLNMARLVDLRRVMVANGDAAKPIWATEMGWTTGSGTGDWQAVGEQQQAAYLVQAFRDAPRAWPWLGLMSVWNLGGEQSPEWGGYSLLDEAGRPRPAYQALQQLLVQGAQPHPGPYPAPDTAPVSAPGGGPGAGQALPGLAAFAARFLASPRTQYQVLAPDVVIHLGHRDYDEPWAGLWRNRRPSTEWESTFYVDDPGNSAWRLTIRLMQSNAWGNHVWINGRPLDASFPPGDFTSSWAAHTWQVPAGLLRPGPNEIKVTITRALPLVQNEDFNWDELQFKDIQLFLRGR